MNKLEQSDNLIILRIAFWASLILLLFLLTIAIASCFPVASSSFKDPGRIDFQKTQLSLALVYWASAHLKHLLWLYCGITFLSLVYLLNRIRGRKATLSFLAYIVPATLMVLFVCVLAWHRHVLTGLEHQFVRGEIELSLYFISGESSGYGGGFPSALKVLLSALLINVPLVLLGIHSILSMRSHKNALNKEIQPTSRGSAPPSG